MCIPSLTRMLSAGMLLALMGCEQEGPAERAGKEIDRAVESAGEKLEQAGDRIRETTSQ